MKHFILLFLSILVCPLINGYIYQVTVLRLWNSERQTYQYVLGLSDFHDKIDSSTEIQASHLDHVLSQCSHDAHTLVLTEDLSSRNTKGCHSCGQFHVNSRGGLLGGLAEKCEQMCIPVHNIEYRYCRVCALGPAFNNPTDSPHTFSSVQKISLSALNQEIDVASTEIESYDDGPTLNSIYQKDLEDIRYQLNFFKSRKKDSMSVADFLVHCAPEKDRLPFLKNWLTFDSGLLDLKLTHTIVNAQDKNTIFIIAGGAHVTRVAEILNKVGYETVYKTAVEYEKESDLSRCVGCSTINGAFCIRPRAINLTVLDQFF